VTLGEPLSLRDSEIEALSLRLWLRDGEPEGLNEGEREGERDGDRDGLRDGEREGERLGDREGERDSEMEREGEMEALSERLGLREGEREGEMLLPATPVWSSSQVTTGGEVSAMSQTWRSVQSVIRAWLTEDGENSKVVRSVVAGTSNSSMSSVPPCHSWRVRKRSPLDQLELSLRELLTLGDLDGDWLGDRDGLRDGETDALSERLGLREGE